MAEDEDKKEKDDIELSEKQQKQYEKLKKSYDELAKSIENLGLAEVERDAELERTLAVMESRLTRVDQLSKKITTLQDTIAKNVEALKFAEDAADEARRKKLIEKQRAELEFYQTSLDVATEGTGDFTDKGTETVEAFVSNMEDAQSGFSGFLKSSGAEILASMGKATLALKALGMEVPNMFSEMRKSVTDLDDARRALIPFTRSVADANALQQQLAEVSKKSGIPITDLGEAAQKAGQEFKMFGSLTAPVQAEISNFAAQLSAMGVEGGAGLIQSIMTDTGIKSAEEAIKVLKGLDVQMRSLGALPKQMYEDYGKLIGTFAMFGESAAANIAKVSFVAQKLQVDVGDITAFGDNFKGYSGAAKAAQTINAVFGRNIIDNPAELVRIFYTGGPGAALVHVREKLFNSGIDLEGMLAGPAGAARVQMLAGLFGTNAQSLRRMLGDRTLTAEDVDLIGTQTEEDAEGAFEDTLKSRLTQTKKIEQAAEQLAVKFMTETLGISLGETGEAIDTLTAETVKAFERGLDEVVQPQVESIREFLKARFGPGAEAPPAAPAPEAPTPTAPATPPTGADAGLGMGAGESLVAEQRTREDIAEIKTGIQALVAAAQASAGTGDTETTQGPQTIQGELRITGLNAGVLHATSKFYNGPANTLDPAV